jgi:hypothetical protein
LIDLTADERALEKALVTEERALRDQPLDSTKRQRTVMLRVALAELDARKRAWTAEPSSPQSWLLPGRASAPIPAWSDDARVSAWLEVARRRAQAEVEADAWRDVDLSSAPPPRTSTVTAEEEIAEIERRQKELAEHLAQESAVRDSDRAVVEFKRSRERPTGPGASAPPPPKDKNCAPSDPLCGDDRMFGGAPDRSSGAGGASDGRHAAMADEAFVPASL